MRVVFIGTPEFAVPSLTTLHQNGFDIAAVFTQPDRPKGRGKKMQSSPVKQKALELDIPVYQPVRIKEPASVQQLRELQPDVIAVVAFGQLLSGEILDLPPMGCINVHSSLLPRYRGAAPMQWAVINGEKVTGVSTMYMDRGLDTGDILLQQELIISPDDTFGQVHDRLSVMGAELLLRTLRMAESNDLKRIPQDDSLSCYAPLLKKEDELLDWNRTAEQLSNHIRGMNPQPGAHTYWQGKILKIWLAHPVGQEFYLEHGEFKDKQPGEIVLSDPKKGLFAATGGGCLQIIELQIQGGKRLKSADFLRGNHLNCGTVLGGSQDQ